MSAPFINVPWSRPFIPALADIALDLTDGNIGDAYFVFPHARPALYLTEAVRRDTRIAKPCIMPRMDSVTGLFSLIRASSAARRAAPAGLLDQMALLLAAVRGLRGERGGLLADLPLDDSRRFFPWGVRLAGLMEELFTHNRVPDDYIHVRGEVTPFAAALLENLGALHARYLAALEERGWTTPGLDAFLAARSVTGDDMADAAISPMLRGKRIILAGFHTLTGSQQVVFRHLWSRLGATVCLHADPAVVDGSPHWSCADLVRWADGWGTKILPRGHAEDDAPEPALSFRAGAVSFRAGYDVHSQLGDMARELAENPAQQPDGLKPDAAATAIVLPDTSLLMPVLHHLPDTDVNISMGYPLGRSPLFRLIETILTLQETRRGTGPYAYHWKSLIALVRHPYLKMLDPMPGTEPEDATGAPSRAFRRFLHHAERVIRTSRRFSTVADLGLRTAETFAEAEEKQPDPCLCRLFERILDAAVRAWEDVASPDGLALALQTLTDLMHDAGSALWPRFPIDAECLYRLAESVIPQLAHTALKEETLPPRTLFAVLRELLSKERVPFEAYPLVGDQILGMLETRLLHFDRIFVLDLTDDALPGKSGHDPLLPDSLRPLAGLPSARGREKVAAYNFFRLINGAREVTVYWQEGVEPQGLNDAKKTRSRFVEELLWREEQRLGRILSPEKPENAGTDGPLRLISCVLPPVPRVNASITVPPAVRARMDDILRGTLSPSMLDAYLGCPAKFFYQRIGRIREVESVTEGRDPLGTGLFLHDVLREFFAGRPRMPVSAGAESRKAIRDLFRSTLADSALARSLPPDDRIMLEEAGPPILTGLLEKHEGRIPLHLEETFSAAIDVDGETRTLAGIIDRVDDDNGVVRVLDYKTGYFPTIANGVWEDEDFWRTLARWRPGDGDDALALLAKRIPGIQLPAYLYLFSASTGKAAHDAAYVPLRFGENDAPLLGDDMDKSARTLILNEKIPLMFTFLLRHMAHAENFTPRPGQHCDWCLYKNMCTLLARQGNVPLAPL